MLFRQVAVNLHCYLHWDRCFVALLSDDTTSLSDDFNSENQLAWGVSVGDDIAGAALTGS